MVHDGTMYVYTGHDEDGADFFWMQEWRVYSTQDMVNWTDHGSPLALESFSWADDRAWASQTIERDGKFYWYICAHSKISKGMAIGVAVSDSPTGPFRDAIGKPLFENGSWDHIDPTVMIESVLSELFTMTCPCWVAMVYSFIELNKAVIHVISLVSFL